MVIDHATGLVWHQGGSRNYLSLKNAKEWVWQLNSEGYAGYHDWRLPTLDEAVSLLEPSKRIGRYIDPVFSKKQEWILTGDKYEDEDVLEVAWYVHFDYGDVSWINFCNGFCVRPVRSVE